MYIGKDANQLSREERKARNCLASPDPFGQRIRSASHFIVRDQWYPLNDGRSRARTVTTSSSGNPITSRRSSLVEEPRRISQGAVWNVGGSSAALGDSVLGIPDGRGGLLAPGTVAPLHSGQLLSRFGVLDDHEAHVRRLAVALDIDPTSRILLPDSTTSPSNSVQRKENTKRHSFGNPTWQDSSWVKNDCVSSKWTKMMTSFYITDQNQSLGPTQSGRRRCP